MTVTTGTGLGHELGWSVGCRRRSTSSPSRWRSSNVAEQLRQQFQIACLAVSRACAREFEQRLEELSSAHGAEVHAAPFVNGSVSKNAMLSRLASTIGSRGPRLMLW